MSIKAEIIADSINPKDCRLTTFILEYPRFVHAELMTHRVFSKNAASSRAIPIEKMIQQVMDNPAMPVWWGKNQSGMQANEELDDVEPYWDVADRKYGVWQDEDGLSYEGFQVFNQRKVTKKEYSKYTWLQARDLIIEKVKSLNKTGLHKQIANRLLEPWFHIRVILSGTDFENFFALRCHLDAQPEIRALAELMLEEYNKSEPKSLDSGAFHIPFGDRMDQSKISPLAHQLSESKGNIRGTLDGFLKAEQEIKIKIAIARCARISYLNFEGKDDYEADIKLCDRLFGSIPRHLSPTEHVAQALDSDAFIGNFRGFKQYRKFFEGENLKDSRVIKKFYKKN